MRKLVTERLNHLPYTTQVIVVRERSSPSYLSSLQQNFHVSIVLGMKVIGWFIFFNTFLLGYS